MGAAPRSQHLVDKDLTISYYSMVVDIYKYDGSKIHTSTFNQVGELGGEWILGSWTGTCDPGVKANTRTVVCSEGADKLCPYMAKPATEDPCPTPAPTPVPPTAPPPPGQTPAPTVAPGTPTPPPTPASTTPPTAGPPASGSQGSGTMTYVIAGLAVVVVIGGAAFAFVKFG